MTETTCVCGDPTAAAMAPNERIAHRTDGPCFIEQVEPTDTAKENS